MDPQNRPNRVNWPSRRELALRGRDQAVVKAPNTLVYGGHTNGRQAQSGACPGDSANWPSD